MSTCKTLHALWTILCFLLLIATGVESKGICTDTRCGGAAKLCCEGSTALQKKDICNEAVTCDSCCGWKDNNTSSKAPHVLFLLVDDLGWADIGAHHAGYETANIDSLLSSGIELKNYHVHLVCSPTRSALMTGQYSFKLGLQSSNTVQPMTLEHIPFDTPTIAELLKKAGYQTHMLGKWHLGYASFNMTPTGRGFDTHYGYFQGMEDYYTHEVGGAFDFFRNREVDRNVTGSYSTVLYNDYMTQLLEEYHESESTAPLFLYMAFQTIHSPMNAAPKTYPACEDVKGEGRKHYCNKMQYLDEVILHYVDMFKQYGLWDDTLLVFSADNGGMPLIHPDAGKQRDTYGCNMPYRAGKDTLFEGGVKGIAFINGGDNVIPSKLRGSSTDILTHIMDWMPTIVGGVVQQEIPNNAELSGQSMWNALMNPENADKEWNRTTLFVDIEDDGKYAGLIDGDYKYFQGQQHYTGYFPCGSIVPPAVDNDTEWLFNLKKDPYEKTNIAKKNKDLVKKYKKMIQEFVENGGYVKEQSDKTYEKGNPKLHGGVWHPWLN